MSSLSVRAKVGLLAASAVGLTLIGALAIYFRRRRRRPRTYRDISPQVSRDEVKMARSGFKQLMRPAKPKSQVKSPNGDIGSRHSSASQAGSDSPSLRRRLLAGGVVGSRDSVHSDEASTVTLLDGSDSLNASRHTPEQLCDLGLEALQTAIRHWETALSDIDNMELDTDNVDGQQTEHLHEQLHELLQRAYRMQEHFEQRLFRQVSTMAALDAALEKMDMEWEESKKKRSLTSLTTDESSDQESFVSALDMADLSDLEDQKETFTHLALYEAALEELEQGGISVRTLRTKMVQCQSDSEFLAKLQCVRLAFQELFKDEGIRNWFVSMGRDLISQLIIRGDKDPLEFQATFDTMIEFVKQEENWPMMEEELRGRGVKMVNFYDIVIDFILFDSFDDLDAPPSSIKSVIQNRWLSNGFKETALSTAVWSVLKAKRRMLKFSNGFIAHFYSITEHISPMLAWGFLGTDDNLRELCYFFKDQILEFMADIFSFDKVRYTTVQHLADDILLVSRERQIKMSATLYS